jgi:hypothetical protein
VPIWTGVSIYSSSISPSGGTTAGIATDKLLALSGDAAQTIRHLHFVDLTDDDLIAFAVAGSQQRSEKRVQGAVVEVPALPAETRHHSEKTARKKKANSTALA